jgi:shikimate kinase
MNQGQPFPLNKHLFLIGYRGSGKTSVARELARIYGCDQVDTDQLVEQKAGMRIREIFEVAGEERFRELETEVLFDLANRTPMIVSLGGGIVLRQENRRFLREHGFSVWLQATPAILHERIQADESTRNQRPALSQLSGYDEIVHLLAKREPLYSELADNIVQTENLSPDKVAKRIIEWIDSFCKGS